MGTDPTVGSTDVAQQVLADRYRLLLPIGTGASSRVYVADDIEFGRRVAVKVLHAALAEDSQFVKRFRAEARAAAVLNHPNIVHVYDSGVDPAFLVMEFVGGGSLRAVLDAGPRLSPSQALVVGLDAARGLDEAHRAGIVHRDIKPANLLFGEDGRLRIADFGLARAIAEAAWTEPQGVLLGTAKYTAPEQAMGREVDGRADVYSLALVLIEAVTGTVPFAGESTAATLMGRCESDVEVPRELGRLAPLLARAGRLDPDDRPDAGELEIAFLAAAEDMERPRPISLPGAVPVDVLDELVALRDGDDVPEAQPDSDDPTAIGRVDAVPAGREYVELPPVAERASSPSRRWPWVLATAAMLAVVFGGAAAWWFFVRTPTFDLADLRGLSESSATRRLREQGLRVASTYVRQDGTKAKQVVGQRPRPGTSMAEGRTVTLEVSLGNSLVAFPSFDNSMSQERATEVLTAAGLKVGAVSTPFDEAVPEGFLLTASAELNSTGELPRGSKVDLAVSAGPAPRTIPPGLVGQSVDAVRQALTGLQLGMNVTETYSDVPVGIVTATNQQDNASVARGTVVEVTVSKGPEPVPIPNVVGQSVPAATAALQAAGFVVTEVQGSPLNEVLQTDPPVGEPHQPGTGIRIFARQ